MAKKKKTTKPPSAPKKAKAKAKTASKSTSRPKSVAKTTAKTRRATVIVTPHGAHGFDDAQLRAHQHALVFNDALERSATRSISIGLADVLAASEPALSLKKMKGVAFRAVAVGGAVRALDDKATFGAGGRVNIGMKQQDPDFPHAIAVAFGGIYASENASTAAVEYRSGGIGEFEMVVLEAKTANVTLIDFDYTVNYLGQLLAPMPVASRVMAVPTYSA